jgi:hypothetical protein
MFTDVMDPRLLALHLETSIQRLSARLQELSVMSESPAITNEVLDEIMERIFKLHNTKSKLNTSLAYTQGVIDINDKKYYDRAVFGQRLRRYDDI